MTADGTGERSRRMAGALRLVVTVVALYALALSTMLTGIAGLLGPSHETALCVSQLDGSTNDPQPTPHQHQAGCCVAACVAPVLLPRTAAVTGLVWPMRSTVRVAWSMDTVAAAQAPPRTRATQRGPPAA